MYSVKKQDISFLNRAKIQVNTRFIAHESAADFWQKLTDYKNWHLWFSAVSKAYSSSKMPYGIGSERTVHFNMFKAKEEFIAWEDQKKWAFSVTALNLPILKAMVEQVHIKQLTPEKIEVYWQVGCDVKWWVKPLEYGLKKDLKKGFDAFIDQHNFKKIS